MLLLAGAIVLGVLIGLALGGSIKALGKLRFLWWPLAFVGLGLQLVPVPSMDGNVDRWLAVGLLILSYVVLLVFVAVNFRVPGFPLIGLAFLLNVLVISVNGGMPVSDQALRRAYGPGYRETLEDLQRLGGAKHHLERPEDVLVPLADVIPIGAPVRQVFSVGDLVLLAGIVWVLAGATKGAGVRARRSMPEWPGGEATPHDRLPRPLPAHPGQERGSPG